MLRSFLARCFVLSVIACAVGIAGCSASDAPPAANPAETAASEAAANTDIQVVVGRAPVSPDGLPTVVMLVPDQPREVAPRQIRPLMDQINLTFVPDLLLVQAGEPVEFRNSEDVMHNVRVRNEDTKEGTFNVALPTGGTYQFTFAEPGFYDVGCDIHPGMSALIIAAPTPHAVVASASGEFTIPDVPAGDYTAVMYVGGAKRERSIQIGAGRTEVDLTGA